MRIITQDKTEDIPYELSTIFVDTAVYPNRIYAKQAGLNDTLLGKYNSHEDAKTALAEVRAAYHNEENVFIMPTADGIARKRLGHD